MEYFKTIGIPLLRGRDFNDRDTTSSPDVIIVNETLARRLAPDGNAIGKRIRMDSQGGLLDVVGVVRDVKYRELAEKPHFFAYRPLSQRYRSAMTLHVRTTADPLAAINPVRAEVRALDPDLPLTKQGFSRAISEERSRFAASACGFSRGVCTTQRY